MWYVVDGGALIHCIPWSKGEQYSQIFEKYYKYIFCHHPIQKIVFDGYDKGSSTKDITHIRRSAKRSGQVVLLSEEMYLTTWKAEFLSNSKNKHLFIITRF